MVKLQNILFESMLVLQQLSERQGLLDCNQIADILVIFQQSYVGAYICDSSSIEVVNFRVLFGNLIFKIDRDTLYLLRIESAEDCSG